MAYVNRDLPYLDYQYRGGSAGGISHSRYPLLGRSSVPAGVSQSVIYPGSGFVGGGAIYGGTAMHGSAIHGGSHYLSNSGVYTGPRKPHSEVQRIPYGFEWVEQVPQKRIEQTPIERSAVDFVEIEHTIDHLPITKVEKRTEYQPVDKYMEYTDYIPIERSHVKSVGGNLRVDGNLVHAEPSRPYSSLYGSRMYDYGGVYPTRYASSSNYSDYSYPYDRFDRARLDRYRYPAHGGYGNYSLYDDNYLSSRYGYSGYGGYGGYRGYRQHYKY